MTASTVRLSRGTLLAALRKNPAILSPLSEHRVKPVLPHEPNPESWRHLFGVCGASRPPEQVPDGSGTYLGNGVPIDTLSMWTRAVMINRIFGIPPGQTFLLIGIAIARLHLTQVQSFESAIETAGAHLAVAERMKTFAKRHPEFGAEVHIFTDAQLMGTEGWTQAEAQRRRADFGGATTPYSRFQDVLIQAFCNIQHAEDPQSRVMKGGWSTFARTEEQGEVAAMRHLLTPDVCGACEGTLDTWSIAFQEEVFGEQKVAYYYGPACHPLSTQYPVACPYKAGPGRIILRAGASLQVERQIPNLSRDRHNAEGRRKIGLGIESLWHLVRGFGEVFPGFLPTDDRRMADLKSDGSSLEVLKTEFAAAKERGRLGGRGGNDLCERVNAAYWRYYDTLADVVRPCVATLIEMFGPTPAQIATGTDKIRSQLQRVEMH